MKGITVLKNLFKVAKLISVDDSGNLRIGSVSFLGKNQSAMLFSPYGIMHKPPADSMVILWSQQGQESNAIGIADDPKNRTLKNLAEGEIAVGNYLTGNYLKFDENGLCTLIAEDLNVVVTNDITVTATNLDVAISGATTVQSGTIKVEADTTLELISGTTMDLSATGALALVAASIGMTSIGAATISAPSLNHGGVNIGSTHIHSQGNDSDGDSEVDTGVPHS